MHELKNEIESAKILTGNVSVNINDRLLFIAGKDPFCQAAADFLKEHFSNVATAFWERGEEYPPEITSWKGEWIISFKSDLVLRSNDISRACKGAINFHPSLPKYPGIGGYVYAIYNKDKRFGVTCHYMAEKVDSGRIIAVRYFDLLNGEKASELNFRAGFYTLALFYEIVRLILMDKGLPLSNEIWGDKHYTHQELVRFCNELKEKQIKHNCLL
jgi:hypothetical protein